MSHFYTPIIKNVLFLFHSNLITIKKHIGANRPVFQHNQHALKLAKWQNFKNSSKAIGAGT